MTFSEVQVGQKFRRVLRDGSAGSTVYERVQPTNFGRTVCRCKCPRRRGVRGVGFEFWAINDDDLVVVVEAK